MNMKQALYFKTIAQYGTITAAAKQLYISQPSLSQTLRQIEDEVGTPLFDRSTSPFHLTYAGERYLKAVEAMLDIETRLKEEIESIRRDDGGRLRLGISVTRAMQVLPDVIPIFTKAYPNVTIELTEAASASLEGLLQKGQIDLALAALEANEANIAYELIEKESIGILAGKASWPSWSLPERPSTWKWWKKRPSCPWTPPIPPASFRTACSGGITSARRFSWRPLPWRLPAGWR